MAITLDSITLPDLVPDNEFGDSVVRSVVKFSLGGSPQIFEQARGGMPIDLFGGADWGWIDRDTLSALKALATVPRAQYTLSYEGSDSTVRFRNESQLVMEAEMVLPRPNAAATDWYRNVRIKLMEVG